jgi:hypothetical protein
MNQIDLEIGAFALTHSPAATQADTTGDLFGATPALKIKHLESFAPSMYFALVETLALLKNGDAEPEDADALTEKIESILKNIQGA